VEQANNADVSKIQGQRFMCAGYHSDKKSKVGGVS
jgi:hypothetical protein